MSYRPIADMWILTRARLKGGKRYYGSYLGGFPERARALLGISIDEPMLHVCGGMARHYPYKRGFGPMDMTLDLDPETKPDFLADARDPFPLIHEDQKWPAILIDPPYSEQDATHYAPGKSKYPSPNLLVKNAIAALKPGGRVGIIHYLLPKAPNGCHFVAIAGVICGSNNRIRVYSVFEKPFTQIEEAPIPEDILI